jgi:L-ascorbate metabolism protein UlaG (beta-lactamase superfamily)
MKPAPFPISDHYNGRIFLNPDGRARPRLHQILRWKLTSRAARWPIFITIAKSQRPALGLNESRATWINHATFLIETPQGNFLTDPVHSRCCGPFGKFGPRRVHAPGLALPELPSIHFVLLSHDHYDHCDLATLRQLATTHAPLAITPLGNRDLLARAGFTRIVELDWWQTHAQAPNLGITVTPSQHWSNRLSGRRCSRLWGGFYLHASKTNFYFVGDTGYHPTLFTEVRTRLGVPDLAFIPIGAYEPRWIMYEQHCNPAEAAQMHRDVGARRSVAMHWGTFQLTDEGRDAPPHELRTALALSAVPSESFQILEPGGNLIVSS